MKSNRTYILRISTTAVMIALTCVLTLAVRIPSPTKGYLNLGDCAVLFGAWLLGPVLGTVAGGVGSALADIIAGYPVYAPGTLVIKALMAAAVSLSLYLISGKGKSRPRAGFIVGAATAEAFTAAKPTPATISNDGFPDGDTATAEIPRGDGAPPTFFKARIEERR